MALVVAAGARPFADRRRWIAYEHQLLDPVEGQPTLSVRLEEVVSQWAWVDAIRAGEAEGLGCAPIWRAVWCFGHCCACTARWSEMI
ncbi:MAG: hypothetical protein ACK4MX_00200 [Thermaurantiacus sp.]